MSELSTADLAGGGTTPRPAERDAQAEDSDLGTSPTRDREPEATPRMSDPATAARPMTTPTQVTDQTSDGSTPLFPTSEVEGFRSRWQEVQTGFVDEPRHAVEQADGMVAEMMQRLAQVFADERGKLEKQWARGDDISTEDLRVALRRYRSFFDRLLSV
jgi:hypothetical protein